jgi:hypothetical protein
MYMASSLNDEYMLGTVMNRHSWTEESVKSKPAGTDRDGDSSSFRQTTAAFRTNPMSIFLDLLDLTRLWFLLLLRYAHRKRFSEGR